jgi:hypothetical protein
MSEAPTHPYQLDATDGSGLGQALELECSHSSYISYIPAACNQPLLTLAALEVVELVVWVVWAGLVLVLVVLVV